MATTTSIVLFQYALRSIRVIGSRIAGTGGRLTKQVGMLHSANCWRHIKTKRFAYRCGLKPRLAMLLWTPSVTLLD
jgi:hypothetical protein